MMFKASTSSVGSRAAPSSSMKLSNCLLVSSHLVLLTGKSDIGPGPPSLWSSLTDSWCQSLHHPPGAPGRNHHILWTGTKTDLVSNLENEVAPEEVEDEEGGEEEVEDVVCREHGQHLASLNAG